MDSEWGHQNYWTFISGFLKLKYDILNFVLDFCNSVTYSRKQVRKQ